MPVFKIILVLVVGAVAFVLACLSPLLFIIFGVFETINMKRHPVEVVKKKSGFGLAEILSTMQTLKSK